MISRWERQKKATKTKAEILQTFIGCPTKLAYTTQNFVEKYKTNDVFIRKLLNELVEEKKLYLIKTYNKFYYCLRTWGSKQNCFIRIERYNETAVDRRFNNDIDPSIMSWHRVKNG